MFIFRVLIISIFPFIAYANENVSSMEKSNDFMIIASSVMGGIILLRMLLGALQFRCPKCKKWWIMKQEKKELLYKESETEIRREEIKDNNGKVLRVEEVRVPVLIHHYEVWRKCRNCGHMVKVLVIEKEDSYNRTPINK